MSTVRVTYEVNTNVCIVESLDASGQSMNTGQDTLNEVWVQDDVHEYTSLHCDNAGHFDGSQRKLTEEITKAVVRHFGEEVNIEVVMDEQVYY